MYASMFPCVSVIKYSNACEVLFWLACVCRLLEYKWAHSLQQLLQELFRSSKRSEMTCIVDQSKFFVWSLNAIEIGFCRSSGRHRICIALQEKEGKLKAPSQRPKIGSLNGAHQMIG